MFCPGASPIPESPRTAQGRLTVTESMTTGCNARSLEFGIAAVEPIETQ